MKCFPLCFAEFKGKKTIRFVSRLVHYYIPYYNWIYVTLQFYFFVVVNIRDCCFISSFITTHYKIADKSTLVSSNKINNKTYRRGTRWKKEPMVRSEFTKNKIQVRSSKRTGHKTLWNGAHVTEWRMLQQIVFTTIQPQKYKRGFVSPDKYWLCDCKTSEDVTFSVLSVTFSRSNKDC